MIDKDFEFKEKYHNDVFLARGGILELSTILELKFNEILLKIGKIETLKNLPFRTKARLVEDLMLKLSPDIDREKFKPLQDFVKLRNVMAHAPIKWHTQKLEFDGEGLNDDNFLKDNPECKDLNIAMAHFRAISDHALNLIEAFIRNFNISEQLKRELSKQLLGGLDIETLENAMNDDMRKKYEKMKNREIEFH